MIPYTYYLFHVPTQQHYYGVRYAKNCDPTDLWRTYFSSSKHVKSLISRYGKESFTYEIRKVFKTKESAITWEASVLRRLSVNNKPHWLNKNISGAIINRTHPRQGVKLTEETKRKISEGNTGKRRSEVEKKQISERLKVNHWNRGRKWSEEAKDKNRQSQHTSEAKKKADDAMKKRYLVKSPSGQIIEVFGMAKFARENGFSASNLTDNGKTKGWVLLQTK